MNKSPWPDNNPITISFVIPAFNEEETLPRTLKAISTASKAFTCLGWGTELIVCDNNSTDATPQIAREYQAKVVHEPFNQIARARNTGAKAAKGDWLIFIDADSSPSQELFIEVSRAILSGKYAGGGSTLCFDSTIGRLVPGIHIWNAISRITKWPAGSFIFCNAAAFREVGGFNNELFVAEEIDLGRKLKKYAGRHDKSFVILKSHPLLTSARKVKFCHAKDFISLLFKVVLTRGEVFKNRNALAPWYRVRHSSEHSQAADE
ncbi:MAG: glycosyltransferase, partial [Verrucomicrobia bacterium]|nr:glycosyltransferase [Verrucomicrobiota bacterium]